MSGSDSFSQYPPPSRASCALTYVGDAPDIMSTTGPGSCCCWSTQHHEGEVSALASLTQTLSPFTDTANGRRFSRVDTSSKKDAARCSILLISDFLFSFPLGRKCLALLDSSDITECHGNPLPGRKLVEEY